MDNLHSCYECFWRVNDECCYRRDENGNPDPVYYEPTDCENFIEDD